MDTDHVPAANLPHYPGEFAVAQAKKGEFPQWSWSSSDRRVIQTSPTTVTAELRALSRLTTEKIAVIQFMTQRINHKRNTVRMGTDFQDMIYLAKEDQARRFKESGYDERLLLEIPYVLQYADTCQISFAQAADEILFRAKMDHVFLARTEHIRMTYFDKVKAAQSLEEIALALSEFKTHT